MIIDLASAADAAPPAVEPTVLSQPGSTTEGGVLPAPAVPEPAPAVDVLDPTPAVTEPTPVVAPAPAPAPVAPAIASGAVTPTGDVVRGRDDSDALTGQFVTIEAGPYEGRYAVFAKTVTQGSDGYPETVLVKTRDDQDEVLQVRYEHLRPSTSGGR